MPSRLNPLHLSAMLATTVVPALLSQACGTDAQPTAKSATVPTSVPASTPLPPDTPRPAPTSMPAATPLPPDTSQPASATPSRSAPTAVPTLTPRPTATPVPTPSPEPTVVAYPAVPGIVDLSNRGWPREVETSEGLVRLDGPPQRVLSYSLGHDEILIALIDTGRFAAVGPFTRDPAYSNVSDLVVGLPTYEKGVENVLAAQPDLMVVSKFTDADIVDLIEEAGVPVVRPALESSAEGNIPTILLMGYMLGVEDRALELVADIEDRLAEVSERVPPAGDASRPAVLSIARYSDIIYAAGSGSTEGGIVVAAGGVNAAARDGIEGHQAVSIVSIAAINPDVVLITQPPEFGAAELRDDLMNHPALSSVPAVTDDMVLAVDPRIYTTLSHWNVRGMEHTAQLLYPDRFSDVTFTDFEPLSGE